MSARSRRADTYPDFPSLLTDQQVDELKETAKGFTMNRNVAFLSLRMSREQLIKGHAGNLTPTEASKASVLMLDVVNEYREHLKILTEIADTAADRLLVAQESMNSLRVVK